MDVNNVKAHLKIADNIIQKINNKELDIGQKVPSVNQLTEQFCVNRNSVVRALARLENQGWVTAAQGKGYFVSEKPKKESYYFTKSSRYTHNMIRLGKTPNARLLDWCLDAPTQEEQKYLNLSIKEMVYRLEILRFRGTDPQSVTTSSLPQKMVPNMEQYLQSFQSLYGILEEHYQFAPIRRYSVIETQLPSACDAIVLEIPESMPVFYKTNLNVHPDGIPVELDIGRARGDLTRYIITLETTD